MRITHTFKDGTVRDSIEGVVVPKNHPVYKVLADAYRNGKIGKNHEEKEYSKGDNQKTSERIAM